VRKPDNKDLQVNEASAAHNRILFLVRSAEATFLELGKELAEFHDARHYETLGYHSFDSYLADPDTNISQRSAYRLMGIYRLYVKRLNLPPVALLPIGITKLDLIRPVVQDNPDEWLAKAQALSKSDLVRELQDNGNHVPAIPIIKEYQDCTISLFYDVDIPPIKINATTLQFTRYNGRFKLEGELK